jgi:hypothetical protein
MKAELRTITPDLAKTILAEKNIGNRPLNKKYVEQLAKEMRKNAWKVNGDTICLNASRLIDGQHRLSAVVLSGVTIQSFVIDGLPDEVFDTKDVGKRRSAGDTLSVKGEANACRLAAALVVIDKYCTGRADRTVEYTNAEVEELLAKYPNARNHLQSGNKAKGILYPSILDACHYLFSQKDKRLADEFVEKAILGIGISNGEPWHLLRQRLMENFTSKTKITKTYAMALCIKTWNAARAGKPLRYLRWSTEGNNTEKFPTIH